MKEERVGAARAPGTTPSATVGLLHGAGNNPAYVLHSPGNVSTSAVASDHSRRFCFQAACVSILPNPQARISGHAGGHIDGAQRLGKASPGVVCSPGSFSKPRRLSTTHRSGRPAFSGPDHFGQARMAALPPKRGGRADAPVIWRPAGPRTGDVADNTDKNLTRHYQSCGGPPVYTST